MKKSCSCNNDITHYNNHKLACSMSSLSLKSNDTIKTNLSNNKNIMKSEQRREKDSDSNILLLKFEKYQDSESITEAKAVLHNLYRVMGITWGEYVFCHDGYAYIRIRM